MSASPRHAKKPESSQPQSTGCEAVLYQETVADPQGTAIVTAFIPESGLLLRSGQDHFRVEQSPEGIVFSALRMPRHTKPSELDETPGADGGQIVSWADRPVDASVVLPNNHYVPVGLGLNRRDVMGVVAGEKLGSLTVNVMNRETPVHVFTPLPPEQQ